VLENIFYIKTVDSLKAGLP